MVVKNIHSFKYLKKIINFGYFRYKRVASIFLYIIRSKSINEKTVDFIGLSLTTDYLPESLKTSIIIEADKILDGYIDCFGLRYLKKINWNTDFISGHEWKSGSFYYTYKLYDFRKQIDVKIPWELSRFQHVIMLAKAFLLTNDLKYVHRIEDDILSWIESNPFMKSINWVCSMDIGIRAVNWIIAIELCRDYFQQSPYFSKIVNNLYMHGKFIYTNNEKNYFNYSSNHYYTNLASLIFLGSFFSLEKEGKKWFSAGKFEFFRETELQFYSDGVNYELSTNYHRLCTEILAVTYIFLVKKNAEIPIAVRNVLYKSLFFIKCAIDKEGVLPMLGDVDDGRFLIMGKYLNWERMNCNYLLAIGHSVFNDNQFRVEKIEEYEYVSIIMNDAEMYQLAGEKNVNLQSELFSCSNLAILKSGNSSVLIKFSNFGTYEDNAWHTHNDILSFDLNLMGERLIVDPGNYCYSRNIRMRNFFRSTKSHNTIYINNSEQNFFNNSVDYLWKMERRSCNKLVSYNFNADYDSLEGENDLIVGKSEKILHRRKFYFDKKDISLNIIDTIHKNIGFALINWNYILHPEVIIKILNKNCIYLISNSYKFQVESNLILEIKDALYSKSYSLYEKTKKISSSEYLYSGDERFLKITLIH